MLTEKEKAARGQMYNPNRDPELLHEMVQTHERVQRYNAIPYSEEMRRREEIGKIVDMGENGTVMSPFFCDYGYNIHIGRDFFSNTNLTILDGARVTIGDHVFIGPNVGIYTAEHELDTTLRAEGYEYAYPVTIGNGVWIGGGVTIIGGVTIGDGAVIGAGSVVTRDIPAGVIAVGNPCRVLRRNDRA